jgi:hypothetical protein
VVEEAEADEDSGDYRASDHRELCLKIKAVTKDVFGVVASCKIS